VLPSSGKQALKTLQMPDFIGLWRHVPADSDKASL
jgi:hypothetical protein